MAIRIDLLTLFPAMADGFLQESVIGRAIEKGTIGFKAHDLLPGIIQVVIVLHPLSKLKRGTRVL